jgi:hypothetical protein
MKPLPQKTMKGINLIHLILMTVAVMPLNLSAQTAKPPGVVVAYSPASSGEYIGSPSIAVLPNGDYVASHDFFGPNSNENVMATSRVYSSSDKGGTWKLIAEIDGAFWSKLFVNKGALYFLGTDKHHGNTLIRKSTDGGKTWTEPIDKTHGLILAGEYHCAPTPVIEYNGRLWRTMESAFGPIREWGVRYGAMMLSAPVNADLLDAANWTSSQPLLYDPTYLDGHFTGWLEGNAVATKDGKMLDILRVDDKTTLSEKAAIVHISPEGKTGTFDKNADFVSFPGGSKKFTIRYDSESGKYWTLSNYIPDAIKAANQGKDPASIRNTLALMSSTDLLNWKVNMIALSHPDVAKHAFQYVDWQFLGKDIIFLSRTAFDDAEGGAHRGHDANFLTFHRIKDFRKNTKVITD